MRKTSAGLVSLVLVAGLGTAFSVPAVSAPKPLTDEGPSADAQQVSGHELPNPLEEKRRGLREQALTRLVNGEAGGSVEDRGTSTVMKVGETNTAKAVDRRGRRTAKRSNRDEYVELSRETTDRIFVILAEFGNDRHPDYPDVDSNPDIPGPTTFDGPLHNAIPEPNRSVDNSTAWQPDYDQAHYQELYFGEGAIPGDGREFESVKTYYERQSSGRYSIDGKVTDWVKVRYNEARYGRDLCGGNVCSNTWALVEDAVNQWAADQRANGMTPRQIRRELATFDQWDRYDHDADGDFNERDGYIDHFQIVHAGGDQANGDPQQGEDAIWSHRWYVQTTPIGGGGPAGNPLGGTQIGRTGVWVGDYTIQPENGGLSVFAHEYAHDLGLPDLYDTQGGRNGVAWWSLMSQSRVSAPQDQGIGTRAADLGAWEKLQLGWLDYEIVRSEQRRRLELGPHEYTSKRAQAAVVVLPKRTRTIPLVAPLSGAKSWWSGAGNDFDHTMSRQVTLPAGTSTLSMQAWWEIEDCGPDACDYAYVEVDDGSGWAAIPGSITNHDEGNSIDGVSEGWVPATFDLSAYAGKTIGLRLRYLTDPAVGGLGFFADDVAVTADDGTVVFESGAETGDEGWALDGFTAAGASMTRDFDNYYIASHRDYVSFDKYLKTGPYNFGFEGSRPNWAEHFPYQDGLLISYWDTFMPDNNTSQHPGEGLILPVDANPRPLVRHDGEFWRPRVAAYDSTFSREKSNSLTLHVDGRRNHIRGQNAKPLFRDNRKYWFGETPTTGVKVPNYGVNIKVLRQEGTSMDIRVWNRR